MSDQGSFGYATEQPNSYFPPGAPPLVFETFAGTSDAAAAAGGVPINGLYQNAGVLRMRLS